jgi:hypothetical protein
MRRAWDAGDNPWVAPGGGVRIDAISGPLRGQIMSNLRDFRLSEDFFARRWKLARLALLATIEAVALPVCSRRPGRTYAEPAAGRAATSALARDAGKQTDLTSASGSVFMVT